MTTQLLMRLYIDEEILFTDILGLHNQITPSMPSWLESHLTAKIGRRPGYKATFQGVASLQPWRYYAAWRQIRLQQQYPSRVRLRPTALQWPIWISCLKSSRYHTWKDFKPLTHYSIHPPTLDLLIKLCNVNVPGRSLLSFETLLSLLLGAAGWGARGTGL